MIAVEVVVLVAVHGAAHDCGGDDVAEAEEHHDGPHVPARCLTRRNERSLGSNKRAG
jgi:hypothetical protein